MSTSTQSDFISTKISEAVAYRVELETQLSGYMRSVTSHNWVVQVGVFFAQVTTEDRVCTGIKMGGVQFATLLTKRDAERLCAGGNIRNGAGEVGTPISIRDALRQSIDRVTTYIAHLEGLNVTW